MKSSLWKFLSVAFLAVLLAACAGKEPPGCSDAATIQSVREALFGAIDKKRFPDVTQISTDAILTIDGAAPTDYNQKILKYSCKARATIDLSTLTNPATPIEITKYMAEVVAAMPNECGANACEKFFEYSTQIVDGGHQVLVEAPMDFLYLLGQGGRTHRVILERAMQEGMDQDKAAAR